MNKLNTKDLKGGMCFTDTVYIDKAKNSVLVGPHTPVRKQDIERLIRWGVNEVETFGELVPESVVRESTAKVTRRREELLQDLDLDFGDVGKESSAIALEEEPIDTKKRRMAQAEVYQKRDCSIPRSLKEHYQSWLDDIDLLYLSVVKGCGLDKDESVRIANEVIEKAQTSREGLIECMHKGWKKQTYLAEHGVNVAIYAAMFGSRIKMPEQELQQFVLGCLYIDIGMVALPLSFFSKDTRPNPEELRMIRAHPLRGYQILVQDNGFPKEVGLVALEHHERISGQGYPRKLLANQLSAFGSIAAIVDTYEAMTRHRSYREEFGSHEAMRTVMTLGQANFDRQYLTTFLREFGMYPVGTYVRLNNDAIAQVIAEAFSSPLKPDVKIIFDEFGDHVLRNEVVCLVREDDLKIVRALNKNETQALLHDNTRRE
jgi:HD-GYP domain-containing protein (c-di-GMP phosphodiesterase class II)